MKLSRVYFCIEGRRAILYINAKFSWVHCPIQAKIFIWFFCFLECPLRVKDSSAAVDLRFSRISRPEVFCKTGVLENFKKNHRKIYVPESLFWQSCRPEAYNFIKEESLEQMFSCEFFKIFKNTFSYRMSSMATSVLSWRSWKIYNLWANFS